MAKFEFLSEKLNKNRNRLLALCYVFVVRLYMVYYIAGGMVFTLLGEAGVYPEKSLSLDDFEHVGVEIIDDMTMINATDDTQLIYTGNIKNLYIKCDFSYEPGEFIAFYSRGKNYSFGTNKMEYARREGDYWVFRFPAGTQQVRLDTGVYPSITVSFEEITANNLTLKEATGFSAGHIFYMLVCPGVIYSVIETDLTAAEKLKKKEHQPN